MDGCDARHNEEVLLCIIDRFVMAITAAEVVDRPVLVARSTLNRWCNPRCDKTRVVGENAFS